MPSAATPSAAAWCPELKWAGVLLGMALGGFFDGILLHQILQWHHLLSAVEGQPWLDLRMQLVADGLFHVLMYAVLVAALVLLYKARQEFVLDGAGRYLLATTVVGFGVWNVLDSIVFHWVLQIHHIKMDAASPLLWDLAWFVVFGVLVLLLGLRMQRSTGRPGSAISGHAGKAAALSLALLVGAAGWQAALAPAAGSGDAVVVFRPGVTAAQAFNAIGRINGQVVWTDNAGAVWAIKLDTPENARALYRSGALLVSHSAITLGCLSWSRAAVAPGA